MSDLPDWLFRPPLTPTERLRYFGVPVGGSPSNLLDANTYDLKAHYAAVKPLHDAYPLIDTEACSESATNILKNAFRGKRIPAENLLQLFWGVAYVVLENERVYEPYLLKPDAYESESTRLSVLRPYYAEAEHFYTHHQEIVPKLERALTDFYVGIANFLPNSAFDDWDEGDCTLVPMIELMSHPVEVIESICIHFCRAAETDKPAMRQFYRLARQISDNILEASSTSRGARTDKLIYPTDLPRETSLVDIASTYLKDTPFLEMVLTSVPFTIPDRPHRMEHTFIIGGAGAGKTTLIQDMLLNDLTRPDPPATVVIDPKGELVRRVQQLALFDPEHGPLRERIVIVDPSDDPPAALNMFHAADRWNRMYSDRVRHRLESQAVSNFAYIFSSIESALTQKQAVCFTFCVRLLFRMQNANITTLMELLDEPAKKPEQSRFKPDIDRLDPTTRNFFERDYYSPAFGETRQQIKARLYGIVMHPTLTAMFSTRERKLDLFDALQRKKIVLVNSSLDAPGSDACQLFSRYFVALTLNAAFERVAVPRDEWHPAFLYVDEFQLVADEVKTPEMLRLAREYNLGIVLAFQDMHGRPFNDALRAAISTNTSIKYASSPEGVDINYTARDLRCDADFIRAQTKTSTHARFGCFVRGMLDRPVSLSIPFGNIKPDMLMPKEHHRELRRRNRDRLSERPELPPAAAPATEETPQLEPPHPSKRRW